MKQLFLLFLILLAQETSLHAQVQEKDTVEHMKLHWEAAGEYTWHGNVMASEYDTYRASVKLVLDSNGYFTYFDNFPMGPEAHEFDLISELTYLSNDPLLPVERFPGEFIQPAGRYAFANESDITLYFFTVIDSYANVKKIKSLDDHVDITLHIYALNDSMTILSNQNIEVEYLYYNLQYRYNYDDQHAHIKESLKSDVGTIKIKLPKEKHGRNFRISSPNYITAFVDDFDTEVGYDYELNVYLNKWPKANNYQHVHEIHGASAIKTGKNEFTLTTVESGQTFVLTKKTQANSTTPLKDR